MIKIIKDLIQARTYPTDVLIFEKRETGLRFKMDKGKRIDERKSGHVYYKLLRGGQTTKPIPREAAIATDKTGRDVVMLFSPADRTFYPMTINPNEKECKAVGEDLRVWEIGEEQLRQQKYMKRKEGLMKYLPIIAPVILALAIVIIVYGMWTYGVAEMIRTFGQTSQALVEASENLAGKQIVQ